MLFDRRYDTLGLYSFKAFCLSKQPNEAYEWHLCTICAVGQWLSSNGNKIPLSQWNNHIDVSKANLLAECEPRTFGALAKRVEDYLDHYDV